MNLDDSDPKALLIDAIRELGAAGIDPERPFSAEIFEKIADRYGIPGECAPVARILLNIAAAGSQVEQRFHKTNKPSARKQLDKMRKKTRAFLDQLGQLLPETESALGQAFLASKLSSMFEVTEDATKIRDEELIEGFDKLFAEFASVSDLLSTVTSQIELLDELTSRGMNVAGSNKPGRPADDTLEELLGAAFQIYVNFIGKPFSLDPLPGGDQYTDAGRFCIDLVEVYDPDVPLTKIATTARRVKESHMKISDLKEVPDFLDNYHKRRS